MQKLLRGLAVFWLAATFALAQEEQPELKPALEQMPEDSQKNPVLTLKVGETGRYLVDQKNQPFLVVGDRYVVCQQKVFIFLKEFFHFRLKALCAKNASLA